METVNVDIREFRDKLASDLLALEAPVAVTRHGNTVRATLVESSILLTTSRGNLSTVLNVHAGTLFSLILPSDNRAS